jgi:hypothetical protein
VAEAALGLHGRQAPKATAAAAEAGKIATNFLW